MNVIEVVDVKKQYKIFHDKSRTLKEKILFANRNKYELRIVLNNINFCVNKGEIIALIGRNGSGKSTLLKLLTKIIYPNKGEIKVIGKVSSLLELGAGFHPDMTGKENIYTNASIFGLTKKEIDNKLNHIIEFSELEEYIDNPVRTYSSGMYARLAFSVAINVEAEVLLIDEVLAVGDIAFQNKCFEKLEELKRKGITIIIVSHDNSIIKRMCSRVIWLENGEIYEMGNTDEIIDKYVSYMNKS